jgi:hypothetical protein
VEINNKTYESLIPVVKAAIMLGINLSIKQEDKIIVMTEGNPVTSAANEKERKMLSLFKDDEKIYVANTSRDIIMNNDVLYVVCCDNSIYILAAEFKVVSKIYQTLSTYFIENNIQKKFDISKLTMNDEDFDISSPIMTFSI